MMMMMMMMMMMTKKAEEERKKILEKQEKEEDMEEKCSEIENTKKSNNFKKIDTVTVTLRKNIKLIVKN